MDSVFNKLRSTVSTVTSTVSQLSDFLPGNPVTREYEIMQHIASAGPGLMWKIYAGNKKSTKQEAAIFVFEKRLLDKWTRKDREQMIDTLKKGIQQLTKLRHPKVLTIQYPLEESRDSLAFATEPVFASLANVLGNNENMPPYPSQSIKDYKLDEIEIKYGLLQICEGLIFLHNDVKLIHGNISPESVVINEQGAWKIFGFDFAISATISDNGDANYSCNGFDSESNPLMQQNLDYVAPEYTTTLSCSPASDIFSLGMVLYSAFNSGEPFAKSNGNWNIHRQNLMKFNTLNNSNLHCIPNEIREFEKRLLSFTPTERPDCHQFLKLEFFHDQGVKTLNYLDSLFQWDNLQKSKFYKGLSDILPKLPHRIRVHRVVPALAQEFVNPTMVPFVLPNVLKIAEWSTNQEFAKFILPHLRPVMKYREPVQILLIFMKYMELLLQKTPADITKSDVLPLIYGSLESDSPQVQELCLSIIPSFASLIDYPSMKNSLLPRIKRLCITATSLPVRVNCLMCIGKILDHLDKWMVIDFILPFLTEIPSREPAVIMGIIGIYKLAITHKKLGLSKEIIATKVIPFVFPLTVENGLSIQQFGILMNFIYDMTKLVETEQKAKLEELGAIQREQLKNETTNNHNLVTSNDFTSGTGKELENVFGDLGLNSNSSSNSQSFHSSQSMPSINSSNSSSMMMPKNSTTTLKGVREEKYKPQDLTSTLISSNLNQLKSQPNTNNSPQLNSFPASQSYHSNLSSSTVPRQNFITPQPQQQQIMPQMNFMTGNPTQYQQQQSRPNYSIGGNTLMQQQSQQMTMPMNNNFNNFPLNSSSSIGLTGVLPSHCQSTVSNQKKEPTISLSKRDIEDFLN